MERPQSAAQLKARVRLDIHHPQVLDRAAGEGFAETAADPGVEAEVGGVAGIGVLRVPPFGRLDQRRVDTSRRGGDVDDLLEFKSAGAGVDYRGAGAARQTDGR